MKRRAAASRRFIRAAGTQEQATTHQRRCFGTFLQPFVFLSVLMRRKKKLSQSHP